MEKVHNISCFLCVKTHTVLSVLVEIGDFYRFEKATKFARLLDPVSSKDSSGDKTNRYGITEVGNTHLRRILIEVAQSYKRENIGLNHLY